MERQEEILHILTATEFAVEERLIQQAYQNSNHRYESDAENSNSSTEPINENGKRSSANMASENSSNESQSDTIDTENSAMTKRRKISLTKEEIRKYIGI